MSNEALTSILKLYVFDTQRRLRVLRALRPRVEVTLALMRGAGLDARGADSTATAEGVDVGLVTVVAEARDALDQATRAHAVAGLELLLARLDAAKAHDQETLRLERRWAAQRSRAGASRDDEETPVALDRLIDQKLSMIHAIATSFARGHDAHGRAAKSVLRVVFPTGLKALIQQHHVGQLANTHAALTAFGGELGEAVNVLGLSHLVDELVALNKRFEAALNRRADLTLITYASLKAQRREGLHRFHECLALVLGVAWQATGPGAALRAALLRPFMEQTQQIRARRRLSKSRADRADASPAPGDSGDTGEPAA